VTDTCAAEQEGEKDAQVEGDAPQTPAVEAEEEATAAAAEPEEPEEITKSYDEYLAERAASQLAGLGKKEGRQVNSETLEGTQFRREAINDFFTGKVSNHHICQTPCIV
jgi:plasminogen activator inhibitor 1 RNA-binding protein